MTRNPDIALIPLPPDKQETTEDTAEEIEA